MDASRKHIRGLSRIGQQRRALKTGGVVRRRWFSGFFLHDFPASIAASTSGVARATWRWRVGTANENVPRATLPSRFDPLHPFAEVGMPRPRLPFGITSTSSTSRLITLSAWMVVGASCAKGLSTGVATRCDEDGERRRCSKKRNQRQAEKREKKRIMK